MRAEQTTLFPSSVFTCLDSKQVRHEILHAIGYASCPSSVQQHTYKLLQSNFLAKLGPLPPGATVHLAHGYDNAPSRALLAGHGCAAEIAREGDPVRAGRRQVVERIHA